MVTRIKQKLSFLFYILYKLYIFTEFSIYFMDYPFSPLSVDIYEFRVKN